MPEQGCSTAVFTDFWKSDKSLPYTAASRYMTKNSQKLTFPRYIYSLILDFIGTKEVRFTSSFILFIIKVEMELVRSFWMSWDVAIKSVEVLKWTWSPCDGRILNNFLCFLILCFPDALYKEVLLGQVANSSCQTTNNISIGFYFFTMLFTICFLC
jgi:hypothetical protein